MLGSLARFFQLIEASPQRNSIAHHPVAARSLHCREQHFFDVGGLAGGAGAGAIGLNFAR
jgi:hypothetical protein